MTNPTQPASKPGSARRTIIIAGAAGLAIVAAAFAVQAAKVDLVNGVTPMSRSMASIERTIDRLGELPAEQRGAYLERTWPHLDEDVVLFLRDQGRIESGARVSRVEFRFGSLDNIWAQEAGGESRFGYVEDQIVAIIHVVGTEKPLIVLVQCLNGTFISLDQTSGLQSLGSHEPVEQFTIGPREGLVHHLDYPAAILTAQRFGLPVYKGSSQVPGNRITYAKAFSLESRTDWTQVTVRVFPGDTFDLANGIYDPANGPPITR